ncbi:hypothetical protein ILUMI_02464 [Ignelater luminosus]|uniref:DNA topoisomerase I n=1 Tax=Ignelater luminosus TaxID=2038154 RepID=A0A8K0DHK7_IGNLU|nr:hypothetical protein ILUMI_02464 [Ignelater luminosus]
MELENSDNAENSTSSKSGNRENSEGKQLNGLSNGYPEKHKSHKSDHKDKHRDKDRDKHRSKDHKSSSKDKEKHSSSSSKDKDRHSSHKSSSKDKERGDREKDRDKDKERDKEKHRDKHRDEKKSSSSSSSKDKEHKSSSKDKEHKSSSSKDKDRERDKDKEERREKHSEKERDKDKDRHGSSKDKDRHSSSKDKHRDKERDRDKEKHHSSSKDKEKKEKRSEKENSEKKLRIEMKLETEYAREDSAREDSVDEDEPKLVIKEEAQSQNDEIHNRNICTKWKVLVGTCNTLSIKFRLKSTNIAISTHEDKFYSVQDLNSYKKELCSVVRWEEEKKDDGTKWTFLEHKGPVFAPPYERIPSNVKFYYDGKEMRLSEEAEEVAGFYARMLDHDYTSKNIFNNNFFTDWRKVMTKQEQATIVDLSKCNFKSMHAYFMDMAEKNRNKTKEEKQAQKEKNEAIQKEYGFCTIDGHKEKIGNFKIEPPGLFRGRGEHPKMGMLKRRVQAEDIIINCSKASKIPEAPPGHKWKEVRHDPSVTWLASWTENVQNQVKYIMLNPSSKLKGEKDWQKYETARRLHQSIDKIRREYKDDWKSKEMRIRQRAVALYFIDKLALRAGNEKDEDQADTVGCCSLRVEHIELHEQKDGREYVVVFDFLGKDSIRYYNEVPVEKRVFKNLQLFMENKNGGDDLFDRLNTSILNKHLNELMEGLTAKVFRTYNASFTLQQQLDQLTNPDDSLSEKILSYNRANRAVAILCNHQRAVPKGHQKSMEKLKEKIDAKRQAIKDAERQVKDAQKDAKHGSVKEKTIYEKKKKLLQRLKEQLVKLEVQETDRDENKTIALGTSKLNYLDPRISVAWCKKYGVPIEKIYNKTQRDKFRWAIDMAGPDYRF